MPSPISRKRQAQIPKQTPRYGNASFHPGSQRKEFLYALGILQYFGNRKMMDLVKRFFGRTPKGEGDQIRDGSHDVHIATCALLLEMASIDGEFSDSERNRIISILKRDYHLPAEHALELIKASNEELDGSVDLWRFTNLINHNYSVEEKIRIIRTVWEIAYTDGKLDKYEDYLVHKLAKLLHLTHKQLIDAKLRVLRGDTFPSPSPEEGNGDS
jgi:uncharacterized tellurite resistance protein B-like protein